jgi:hypothetical protein
MMSAAAEEKSEAEEATEVSFSSSSPEEIRELYRAKPHLASIRDLKTMRYPIHDAARAHISVSKIPRHYMVSRTNESNFLNIRQ